MRWFRRSQRGEGVGSAGAHALVRGSLHAALDDDLDRVEALLSRIVRDDSSDIDAYLGLARVYRDRGDTDRAIGIHQTLILRRDLDRAQRIHALAQLGADFRAAGIPGRAIASFEEVLEHDAKHLGALRELESILPQVGEHARALVILRRRARAEGRRDKAGEARMLAGQARAAMAADRHDVARRAIKRALRRDARSVEALVIGGELEAARGRYDRAVALWLRVPEASDGRERSVYPLLASGYDKLRRPAEWVDWLRTRVEASPDDAAARVALGRALAESGNVEAAVAELRRLRRGNHADLATLVALGRVLVSVGHERAGVDAIKAYEELLEVLEARLTDGEGVAS